jgi:hypothetical protein
MTKIMPTPCCPKDYAVLTCAPHLTGQAAIALFSVALFVHQIKRDFTFFRFSPSPKFGSSSGSNRGDIGWYTTVPDGLITTQEIAANTKFLA